MTITQEAKIQVAAVERVFLYNGMRLNDPDPTRTPAQIMDLYSLTYPELVSAIVEGPVTKAGKATYKFLRAAGAKG